MRWLCPPPIRTAYFCAWRSPGRVLRVSMIFTSMSATVSTYCRVRVAVADKVCRKFSAPRSAVNKARALPRISHNTWPGFMRSPSCASQLILQCGSCATKQPSNHCVPHSTPACRVTTCALDICVSGSNCAVKSPLPRSSLSARLTSSCICLARLAVSMTGLLSG